MATGHGMRRNYRRAAKEPVPLGGHHEQHLPVFGRMARVVSMNRGPEDDAILLTVPSDPQSLAVIRAVVEALSKLANFDKQACYEIVTAVNEACSNVIRHAHLGQRHLPMTLVCRVSRDGLEVRLRDEGAHFDFAAVPEIDPTEIRKGGRGAFLIRRFVDDVASSPLPEGGNELRLFKRTACSE